MPPAILTKYIGPTDFKPGRIRAVCEAGTLLLPWDHNLGVYENHREVASVLAHSFGWLDTWKMVGGFLPQTNQYAYAFVLCEKKAL